MLVADKLRDGLTHKHKMHVISSTKDQSRIPARDLARMLDTYASVFDITNSNATSNNNSSSYSRSNSTHYNNNSVGSNAKSRPFNTRAISVQQNKSNVSASANFEKSRFNRDIPAKDDKADVKSKRVWNNKKSPTHSEKGTCYFCKKPGHLFKECRALREFIRQKDDEGQSSAFVSRLSFSAGIESYNAVKIGSCDETEWKRWKTEDEAELAAMYQTNAERCDRFDPHIHELRHRQVSSSMIARAAHNIQVD